MSTAVSFGGRCNLVSYYTLYSHDARSRTARAHHLKMTQSVLLGACSRCSQTVEKHPTKSSSSWSLSLLSFTSLLRGPLYPLYPLNGVPKGVNSAIKSCCAVGH